MTNHVPKENQQWGIRSLSLCHRATTYNSSFGSIHILSLKCTNEHHVDCRPTVGRHLVGQLSVDDRPTVHRQSTDCPPTVNRLSTDSRPTAHRPLTDVSVDCRWTVGQLSVDRQLTNCPSTVDWYVGRLSTNVTYMMSDPLLVYHVTIKMFVGTQNSNKISLFWVCTLNVTVDNLFSDTKILFLFNKAMEKHQKVENYWLLWQH